ncbi:glucokinase [Gammaproteobacteria bacterium]|nr:glucokinase [Gammaproteobacteria bacterium]
MLKPWAIYADIGGTNSRFALQMDKTAPLEHIKIYASSDFNEPSDAILRYLHEQDLAAPEHIAIAIACPITGDALKMTNIHWNFSIAATKAKVKVDSLYFLNDFEALVLSLPDLKENEIIQVGTGVAAKHGVMGLIGPGTGVGVASIVHAGESYQALPCEGGHGLYPPQDFEELEIIKFLMRPKADHAACTVVSIEDLLSGSRGIGNLIKAMASIHAVSVPNWSPKELVAHALIQKQPFAISVLARYCAILGNAAGNVALTVGATGGMYIGGGIVPRLGQFFVDSAFRACFENKDIATYYVKAIPTFMICAQYPALLGAQSALKNILKINNIN